ncbi:MAG: response regulator [Elusimicrobia bacterium]|nr:response regulator [Elusimicrobiota bacterium]
MDKAKKILIVEDSKSMSAVLQEVLESQGYEVTWANNGIDGIRLAKSEKPDLILLDLLLPKLNGYEVCNAVKRNNSTRHIKILIISTLGDKDHMEKAKLCGAKNFMKKPYNLQDLLTEIKNII